MKNASIIINAILLLIAAVNYFMITYDGSVRTVEFLSIFAIGAFAGVLLTQIIIKMKGKNKTI